MSRPGAVDWRVGGILYSDWSRTQKAGERGVLEEGRYQAGLRHDTRSAHARRPNVKLGHLSLPASSASGHCDAARTWVLDAARARDVLLHHEA